MRDGAAYYNENDPYAAQWLRNLIAAGHIASGDVDERSIVDIRADDLRGYIQCHFFAGIGGWSYAMRLAGWPNERPVWTGSCPCQPFSSAEAGKAADDERHLWPTWFSLIAEFRPAIVFGEQVEAAIGWGWLDLVFADLEGQGYACGATVLPACGIGAPHIRQRLWFVADAASGGFGELRNETQQGRGGHADGGISAGGVGNAEGRDGRLPVRSIWQQDSEFAGAGEACKLGDASRDEQWQSRLTETSERRACAVGGSSSRSYIANWRDAEFIPCADAKARPVEPGTFPLAYGIPGRVGRLRAYGNAIVPQVAAEFIGAVMECMP